MMNRATVSHRAFGIMVFLVFWGVIGIGMVSGVWESKMSGIDPDSMTSPAEIKGWMTAEDILCAFDIDKGQFFAALDLPADTDLGTKAKDLGKDLGFETERVKEVVAQLLGVPLEGEAEPVSETSSQPTSPETETTISSTGSTVTAPEPGQPAGTDPAKDAPSSEGSGEATNGEGVPRGDGTGTPPQLAPVADASEIRGRSTFAEVSSVFGVPAEYIFEKLGIPKNQNPNTEIKDLTAKYGFEVSDVRTLVEEYLKAR